MNIATPADSTQLVIIPQETALSVFTTERAMDPFMERIRKGIDAFTPDISTVTGRKAVASMAYKVAQTKTYLESVGKALADDQKEIPKKIDACRKRVRDTLDGWRDEVRRPLTDWETAEDARIKVHTDAITVLNDLSRNAPGQDSVTLKAALIHVETITIGPTCEEFEAEYARAKDAARAALTEELPKAERRESDAAELIRLRAESDARAQADREEQIRRDAAAQATRDAEAAAQRKLDEQAAETARAEAEAQRKLDEEAARTAAALKEAEDAKRYAAETEARLKKDAEDEANRVAADAARREADKEHRATINRAALAAFVAGGISEETAKQVLILIASRQIPAITIFY